MNALLSTEPLSYFTSGHDHAIALNLVTQDEFSVWLEQLTEPQQNWVKAHDYKAESGKVITLFTPEGQIDQLAYITDNEALINPSPWLISNLIGKIPPASYHIKNELDDESLRKIAIGWALAQYDYDFYKKESKKPLFRLLLSDELIIDLNKQLNPLILVRHMVNTPAEDMGPDELSALCYQIADHYDASYSEIKGDELLTHGFNTIHTVGRAAEKEPRLIDMRWGDDAAPKLTLVGKGVCFDTGGLDIKPSSSMLLMKKDMGGAAHVLGLAQMIMEAGLEVNLRVLIPAVENNVSANSFRPGDVIRTYKGTTVEVGNTDAEGRLVLCDALAYASEDDPDLILDFATLTGAARVAMGTDIVPFFTDGDDIVQGLTQHAAQEADPLWQLPLYQDYESLLKSNIADMNNISSGPFGGCITAALYLKHFVKDSSRWVHYDVFAWNNSDRPGRPRGGEAMALRATFSYLCDRYKS